MRCGIDIALAVLLLGVPSAFGAAETGRVKALPADYVAIVEKYKAGDPNGALAMIGAWDETRVRAQVDLLKRAVVTIRSCAGCEERVAFASFPLHAALLLHADGEIQQNLLTPVSEQRPKCGSGPHAFAVEHLAAIDALVNPDAGLFLRRLFLAFSRQAVWSHCLVEADTWARAGLRLYPKDASLKLALGIAAEKTALFTLRPAPVTLSAGARGAVQSEQVFARIRGVWETARLSFEEALALDGSLVEARLRLGRVLWRTGSMDKARETLDKVLAETNTAGISYLAHLFLGRVIEESGSLDAAEEHYRAALSLKPRSEHAAVAVSHVRLLKGDGPGARKILIAQIELGPSPVAFDPWLTYSADQENQGEALLAVLRNELK